MVLYNSFGYHGWLDFLPDESKSELDIFSADIRDPFRVSRAMDDIDCVFHLASLIAIPYSYLTPASYVATNVTGTLNLLQAAREASVKRFVHTSTSEVYGTAQMTPMDEKHPIVGQSPYAASKIGADQMAASFGLSFGLPVTTLRPFNTFGPRQSARAIIPTIICQLATKPKQLKLGNLKPTRDFTYIDDLTEAFVAIASVDGAIGKVVNVGSGEEISIGDLARRISELMEVDVEIIEEEERLRPESSEVDRLLCDNSLASDLLGWERKISLTEGLRKTINWFADEQNLRGYHSNRFQI